MNHKHPFLAASIMALVSVSAYANSTKDADRTARSDDCDSSGHVSGWGVWCGIGELEATAAGASGSFTLNAPLFPFEISDAEGFGGEVPEFNEETHKFYRAGYAATYDENHNETIAPLGSGTTRISITSVENSTEIQGTHHDNQENIISDSLLLLMMAETGIRIFAG